MRITTVLALQSLAITLSRGMGRLVDSLESVPPGERAELTALVGSLADVASRVDDLLDEELAR